MNVAIVVLSDPKSGTDESTGRLFNGLAAAYDLRKYNHNVKILFLGAASRWAARLHQSDHPLHGLYELVRPDVAGISCACSDAFGAHKENQAIGATLLTDNAVPGTSGLPSLADLLTDGYQILTF